jgi:hypothetical protein
MVRADVGYARFSGYHRRVRSQGKHSEVQLPQRTLPEQQEGNRVVAIDENRLMRSELGILLAFILLQSLVGCQPHG